MIQVGVPLPRGSSVEEARWVLVDSERSLRQRWDLAAEKPKKSWAVLAGAQPGDQEQVIIPFCSALLKPYLESYIQFRAPNLRKSLINGREFSEGPPIWSGGLEHLSYKKKLRELGLHSLEQRCLWESPAAALVSTGRWLSRWRQAVHTAVHGRRQEASSASWKKWGSEQR